MNTVDIILIAVIAAVVGTAIFVVVYRKIKGKGSCSCGCENCAYKCKNKAHNKDEKRS